MSNKIELVKELLDEIRYLRKLCEENNIDHKREETSHLQDENSIINSFEFDSMTGTLLLLNNISNYNKVFLDDGCERNKEKLTKLKNGIDVLAEIKVGFKLKFLLQKNN
ncbi:hypothetical protein HWI79_554 [Cryptosporidium felis]|nr:hypothetical protein HWI79_554 [Cryptosporidium felis]